MEGGGAGHRREHEPVRTEGGSASGGTRQLRRSAWRDAARSEEVAPDLEDRGQWEGRAGCREGTGHRQRIWPGDVAAMMEGGGEGRNNEEGAPAKGAVHEQVGMRVAFSKSRAHGCVSNNTTGDAPVRTCCHDERAVVTGRLAGFSHLFGSNAPWPRKQTRLGSSATRPWPTTSP